MTRQTSHQIQLLPEHIIDQIKAGEVVEKPASVLKELIENSIDAEATHVKIRIQNNGMDLISIEDDGRGISFESLPLAFHRHATSKISKFEDLYSLHSFGFRGEALASISSVARVTCTSFPVLPEAEGGKYTIEGGKILGHSKLPKKKPGTTLTIKDLFFNTPVRLKFTKSPTSEKNAIIKVINYYLIAYPEIAFTIQFDLNPKEVYRSLKEKEHHKRFHEILKLRKKKTTELIPINGSYGKYSISGFYSPNTVKSAASRLQYIFANSRPFQDTKLHKAITLGLKKIWPVGLTGHYLLFISAPTEYTDVNVHPNKISIKFYEEEALFALIHSTFSKSVAEQELPEITQRPEQIFVEDSTPYLSKSLETQQEGHSYVAPNLSVPDKTLLDYGNHMIFIELGSVKLIRKMDLYESILKKAYERHELPLSDDHIIPLLISEPMGDITATPEQIQFIADYGFDLYQHEDGPLILKSVPLELKDYPYTQLAVLLLMLFQRKSEENYSLFEKLSGLKQTCSFQSLPIQNFSQTFRDLIKNFEGPYIELDDNKIERFFNE